MPTKIASIDIPDYMSGRKSAAEASPLKILQEAAEIMGRRTNGFVMGKVFVAPFVGTTRYTFYLTVPSLDDYSDPLFYVWTDKPDYGYPVHVVASQNQEDDKVYADATKFADRLTEIFKAQWVIDRISQMIHLAQDRIS